jgi:hypothetical protein
LPPGILQVEEVPASDYVAHLNFGGLILTVVAPCGCKIHYDTSEFSYQNRRSHSLQCCHLEDCGFEWSEAERAALALLAESSTSEPATIENNLEFVDLGGEG